MASLFELPITIYSEITPYNDVLSKARCRVFYKYENRMVLILQMNLVKNLLVPPPMPL